MSAIAINGNLHLDGAQPGSKPSSPASPSLSFQNQQAVPARSFINFGGSAVRGQTSPFPATPTSGQMTTPLDPPSGVPYAEFIRTWSDSHVARWLTDIKCGNHAATFKANDIRGDILLELDQVTLKEMGVSSIGDRLRIVNAVKILRQKASTRTTSNSPMVEVNRMFTNDAVALHGQDSSPPNKRPAGRSGRPAPLVLGNNPNRNDLPRLVREQNPPDSARSNTSNGPRPLPHPNHPNGGNGAPSISHSNGPRTNLPPLPPPPRGQPPLPPPGRQPPRLANISNGGRRTPTQAEAPGFTNQALPPAPQSQGQNQGLLTPSSASNWMGYHLPADPRPGSSGKSTPRSTSPLQNRPNVIGRPIVQPAHGRNVSLGNNSPVSSPYKLPPRPSTSNSHPYATASALQAPPSNQPYNLSPIAESFVSQHSVGTGTPSPPAGPYTVGRGPFNPTAPSHANAPSLDDLRRKLVKFLLPAEGHSCTIDPSTCVGGVELLEKVLKKFGKSRSPDSDSSTEHVQTDEGGLIVDGWGVFLDWGQGDGPGEPLTEAEICAICYGSPDNPAREHGLTLRKVVNKSRSLGMGQTSKATKRASSISILSGLGVHDPEKALDPSSPTTQPERRSPVPQNLKKLRNFFGQRPPSELITTHLTEYFPFTEKKVLERTARHSMMMRNGTLSSQRDSSASFIPPLPSRFSVSTQGSQRRMSSSPRASIISGVGPQRDSLSASPRSALEDIPRVSLSTEDGNSMDLQPEDAIEPSSSSSGALQPLLPPIPFPSESLSESMESLTGGQPSRPVSRAMSLSSRRMSYMTELRSKRDRSDTASMVTVDEITAEVESRRESKMPDTGLDNDDWLKVDPVESADSEAEETTVVETEEDTLNEDEEEYEDEPGKPVRSRGAVKWIKGALIGAGSFGKVYLGMDASSGLLMAVKQVELPTGSAPNQERKKSMLSALEREIELLKDLQHENIVQYLYSSVDEEFLNIFLEYVPGGSVSALLRNYGAFEEPLVKNFVRQILQGLNYLHEKDIIHRDIKGANILVDNKGGIKISDFGISKKVEDNLLTGGNRIHRPSLQGSVFWMAPEVVKQTGHTHKADIWSVGCLVVEMLTGEHPWAQLSQMQAIFKIGSMAKPTIPSDISAEAQDFLARTFEISHEARPSATELLLHSWIAKKPPVTKAGAARSNSAADA
ncbi:Pkinase-domain-containing protein [Pleurotus eryngii]|uniref:mitogen-activated protein kinase kinase kinase n=1 Tax=Pleurotus eryngii TaxID=5323 RepID=A0A9P6A808_PLEER|nr:Pkinase-domain-containing protein [Pleurotus eryngii]